MADFNDGGIKQVGLPPQARLPGDETKFFPAPKTESQDWLGHLGDTAIKAAESFILSALKAPATVVDTAVKGISNGVTSGLKGISEGIKDAINEIRNDIKDAREAKSSPQREHSSSRVKDGQREAKATPAREQAASMRPKAQATPQKDRTEPLCGQVRPNGPQQNGQKTWGDAPKAPEPSFKSQDKEPQTEKATNADHNVVRPNCEPAKDVAARTAHVSANQPAKESQAEKPEAMKWAAPVPKVSEKVAVRSVESVLKEARAKEVPAKENSIEKAKAPEKSQERTR